MNSKDFALLPLKFFLKFKAHTLYSASHFMRSGSRWSIKSVLLVSSVAIFALSSALNAKSNTAKFSRIRSMRVVFGMTMTFRSISQRKITQIKYFVSLIFLLSRSYNAHKFHSPQSFVLALWQPLKSSHCPQKGQAPNHPRKKTF